MSATAARLKGPAVRVVARKSTRHTVMPGSLAGTGMSYATTKSTRNDPDRLVLRKYDQKVMQVAEFREHR
jgi:large subunit ribosomal protein L33